MPNDVEDIRVEMKLTLIYVGSFRCRYINHIHIHDYMYSIQYTYIYILIENTLQIPTHEKSRLSLQLPLEPHGGSSPTAFGGQIFQKPPLKKRPKISHNHGSSEK